jgi:tRNA (guanine-N7-)-methyltransferase
MSQQSTKSTQAQPKVDLLWTHVLFFGAENPNYISEQTRPACARQRVCSDRFSYISAPIGGFGAQINQPVVAPAICSTSCGKKPMVERAELPEGLQDLRPWFTAIHEFTQEINWREFWGNDNPVELDVGAGRGLFVFNASLNNPNTNFLGLELNFQEARRAGKRLHKRQAENARMIGGDALVVLKNLIPQHSVDAVHVYFPDPWWRTKHRRRRIFTDALVAHCSQILKPGGMLHSWTDVENYFMVIQALMDHHDDFETKQPLAERAAEHDMDYQTSFERKKRKNGLPIYRGLWQRRPLA